MRQLTASSTLICLSAITLFAQTEGRLRLSTDRSEMESPLVTAATSGNSVRFTALALTQKIRLEVPSETGVIGVADGPVRVLSVRGGIPGSVMASEGGSPYNNTTYGPTYRHRVGWL